MRAHETLDPDVTGFAIHLDLGNLRAGDPGETSDVSLANPEIAERLSLELEELVGRKPKPHPNEVQPDLELLEKLRSLGYIQ